MTRSRPRPAGSPARCTVTVCRGCCCGNPGKNPHADHAEQLDRLRQGLADTARLRLSDCLGVCEQSNVIVIQPSATGRAAGGRPLWLGFVFDLEVIADIAAWITSGRRRPLHLRILSGLDLCRQLLHLRISGLGLGEVGHLHGLLVMRDHHLREGDVDPTAMLNRLALTQQILTEQDAKLQAFTKIRDAHRRAQTSAKKRTAELRASLKELDAHKDRAEKLIDKIKDKIDLLYPTPGARSADGTWVPQLPSGPDNITPRMRLVRQLIAQRFGPQFGIGCYRADGGIQGGGEHPLGRACDFMLSRGGAMPSAAETQRGNEIAAWAIKNAQRLGIMYIIFRQQIWHVRTGAWKTMSNRGGTTANHYDHPHISVY
jgi:hypothetical protein